MHGIQGGYSSLADWNKGYENVSLPAAPAPAGNGPMPPPPVPQPLPGGTAPMPIAPVPVHPTQAYGGAVPHPPAQPPSLPPSPGAEARGTLVYRNLDGFLHPDTPGPSFAALPHEAAPAPPQPAHPPWMRPESPTLKALQANRDIESIFSMTMGTSVPAGVKDMTPDQAAAATLFKNNMDAFDPTGILRKMGEFGQSYRPEGNGLAANADIHYMAGGSMFLPPESFRPGTTQMIHSHPDHGDYKNDYPSDADYLHAYWATQGNAGPLKGEMFYHPGSDKFFGYEPKVDGQGMPGFHELVNPYDMGPPVQGFQAHRPLPDPATYGHHFIDWPPPGTGYVPPAA